MSFGAGTYKVEEYDHDWGRSDERWTMHCVKCRPRYLAYQYAHTEKGRNWLTYVWVPKTSAEQLSRLDDALKEGEARILEHATDRYLDRWMAIGRSADSKKRLWEILTDSGATPYPSLTTFYKHAKRIGVERYWRSEFSVRNVPRIIGALNIKDTALETPMVQLDQMRTQRENFESSMIAAGFS